MHIRNTGFTLIELAMVLFILGLLLSSFLAPLAARVEQQERKNTQIQLNEIVEVIYGYVLKEQHFPCPDCSDTTTNDCDDVDTNDPNDIDDGEEDYLAGTCATETGNLPWVTLGVKKTDEWDNVFTYRVDDEFADNTDGADSCTTNTTLNVSFSLCSDGDITVLDSSGGGNVATRIPAIVVSEGKNWVVSTSADEAENTDGDATFVDKDYSQTDGSEFDDMLIWISPHILRTMAVKSGILP